MEFVSTVLSYSGYIILLGAVVAAFFLARLLVNRNSTSKTSTNHTAATQTLKKNWQLVALAVIGLAVFLVLFDQIEAVLAWIGMGGLPCSS